MPNQGISATGWIKETPLAFGNGTDVHPLRGLIVHKPADHNYFRKKTLRIATIAPTGEDRIPEIISRLQSQHQPNERKDYLQIYTGFTEIFGLQITTMAQMELPATLYQQLYQAEQPVTRLKESLVDAINSLKLQRANFDVLLIYIPKKWEAFIRNSPSDRYLHDYLKGLCAEAHIPMQILREASAFDYSCNASVMWRLAIALYTKAGGIPWKIANYDKGKAHIGISYAMRPSENGNEYVTCCSQMFDPDGTGFEFVAYDIEECDKVKDNPYLTRDEMFKVMNRSLSLYQDRHNGSAPSKITVHKRTHFTEQEVEACLEAFPENTEVELIQICQTPWLGIKVPWSLSGKSSDEVKKDLSFPVERGSYLPVSESQCLLWIQGNVYGKGLISNYPNYYKEQIRIPRPVLLKRFTGDGGWHETCRNIIGLSKMDWNNDALYNYDPVTLAYSDTLANVIKHMPTLTRQAYQYRLFM
jgi:hypothetical protein